MPCGKFRNEWTRYYCDNTNLPIHLLGGSPLHWRNEINNYSSRIYSCDGNYLCKVASYGKVYLNFTTRKPYPFEVLGGKDFIYRCYDFSLNHLKIDDLFSRQLKLKITN